MVDVFASPYTGTSLREAALCGLPIIAYDMDWVKNFLINENNTLLVEPHNVQQFAEAALLLMKNKELSNKIGENARVLANQIWSLGIVNKITFTSI